MIYFHIYINIVTKWKHGTSTNDIIIFNENLENVSTALIELKNIDESSHEEAPVLIKIEHI